MATLAPTKPPIGRPYRAPFIAADRLSGAVMLALISACIPIGHHLARQRARNAEGPPTTI